MGWLRMECAGGHDDVLQLLAAGQDRTYHWILIVLLLSPFSPTISTHILNIGSTILADHATILFHNNECWNAANLEMLLDLFLGRIIKFHCKPVSMRFDHILDHVIMGPI